MGQLIGAIVADTKTHAQRAAKAVTVDYDVVFPIITIQVISISNKKCNAPCNY